MSISGVTPPALPATHAGTPKPNTSSLLFTPEAAPLSANTKVPIRERSEHADLPQEPHLVVEEILFDDLAICPTRDRAELELERLARRLVHLAVEPRSRAGHLPFPPGNRAGPVARAKHHANLQSACARIERPRKGRCLLHGAHAHRTSAVRAQRPVANCLKKLSAFHVGRAGSFATRCKSASMTRSNNAAASVLTG